MASGSSSVASTASTVSSRKLGTPAKGVALAKKRRAAAAAKSTRVSLERVLGLNCHGSFALSCSDQYAAYPAGCVAVLQDLKRKNKQFHIFTKKPISCLAFSPDGKYLATGEYGHQPSACVWELKSSEPGPYATFKVHSFGVQCVAFSTGQNFLVTVGYRFDRQIIVWNWKTSTQLLYGKFGQTVNCLAFSENHENSCGANYFVTGHRRRVQFWFFDTPSKEAQKRHQPATSVLKARSAILGDFQNNEFVGVACGTGPLAQTTYALTKSGKLCLFNKFRMVEKFTEVKAEPARCMILSESYLFCGCRNGTIRLFDPYTLDYIITLPYPHTLGVDIATPVMSDVEQQVHPDTVAMDAKNHKLSVVYNDHSFYVWDVSNVKEVKKSRSSLFHSACVWDICTYPYFEDESKQMLPDSCFITCSSDNTVRFWCLEPHTDQWNIRNIYSKELIRVIYNEGMNFASLKDTNLLPGDASAVADVTRGVRSIVVHRNGQHLAAGDREGNLRIYDLQFMDKIYEEVAHDAEILSLGYSKEVDGVQFLATASRDRMVHVFSNTEDTYEPIQSLPDHSAAVTAVHFTEREGNTQLLSAGADKCILYHALDIDEDGSPALVRFHQVVAKSSIYDMAVDAQEKYFLISGQDKFIRMYGVTTGKKHTVLKVPVTEEGSVIKVALDPSGLYAAASVTDKSVLIFDIYMGECIGRISGHSEVITQLKFSRDCKYLYTVSGDSCIFVWSLWPELVKNMHDRLAEINQPIPGVHVPRKTSLAATADDQVDQGIALSMDVSAEDTEAVLHPGAGIVEPMQPDFDFRLSMLPVWARKVAMSRPSVAQQAGSNSSATPMTTSSSRTAEGKWAERLVESELTFASEMESDSLMGATTDAGTIDRKEELEQQMMGETPIVMESPDLPADESPELPRTASSEESDTDGDSFPPTSSHHLDVDPKEFTVTTPTKPAVPPTDADDDEADSANITPNVSPPLKTTEDKDFIQANYQSLEKINENTSGEPRKLQAFNSRLSISAKFHRMSRMQLMSDSGSPELPDDPEVSEGEGEEAQDEASESGDERLTQAKQSSKKKVAESVAATSLEAEPMDENDNTDPPNNETDEPIAERRSSFEVAVNETKKRLQDLGYDILSSEKEILKEAASLEVTSPSPVIEDLMKEEERGSLIERVDVVGGEDETPGAALSAVSSRAGPRTEPKSLTARTNSVLTSLDANFKALTALNAEALRTNNSSAIGTISRGIAAHKVKVANWSTKNRKLWRRKGKTTPSVDALASGAATAGGAEEDVGALDVGLGPKEVQQANELLDKLKKILSQ